MEREQINVHLANSYFTYAQILIIASGFFFAFGGISYQNMNDNIIKIGDLALNVAQFSLEISKNESYLVNNDQGNISDQIKNLMIVVGEADNKILRTNYKIFEYSFLLAFISFGLSLISWIQGHNIIKNLKSN